MIVACVVLSANAWNMDMMISMQAVHVAVSMPVSRKEATVTEMPCSAAGNMDGYK